MISLSSRESSANDGHVRSQMTGSEGLSHSVYDPVKMTSEPKMITIMSMLTADRYSNHTPHIFESTFKF